MAARTANKDVPWGSVIVARKADHPFHGKLITHSAALITFSTHRDHR
jgi:hypothetical protein